MCLAHEPDWAILLITTKWEELILSDSLWLRVLDGPIPLIGASELSNPAPRKYWWEGRAEDGWCFPCFTFPKYFRGERKSTSLCCRTGFFRYWGKNTEIWIPGSGLFLKLSTNLFTVLYMTAAIPQICLTLTPRFPQFSPLLFLIDNVNSCLKLFVINHKSLHQSV